MEMQFVRRDMLLEILEWCDVYKWWCCSYSSTARAVNDVGHEDNEDNEDNEDKWSKRRE
jgi:hypothetical protein